jgi:hypothetical protein
MSAIAVIVDFFVSCIDFSLPKHGATAVQGQSARYAAFCCSKVAMPEDFARNHLPDGQMHRFTSYAEGCISYAGTTFETLAIEERCPSYPTSKSSSST